MNWAFFTENKYQGFRIIQAGAEEQDYGLKSSAVPRELPAGRHYAD